ncbi:MAG: flavin reductase [Cyclobacteriaceae bacterium]
MKDDATENLTQLDIDKAIWERFFTPAPIVVIGTREGNGHDLAPKHMVTPLGWGNYFGFVCTPKHGTYHNVKHYGSFTVTYPKADQMVLASLAATPRYDKPGSKPITKHLPTFQSEIIDGIFLRDGYLFLECELDRIIDGFGANSLITGKIVAAQVDEGALRNSEIDDQELLVRSPLPVYLNPGRFAVIKDTIAFPFPANFQK